MPIRPWGVQAIASASGTGSDSTTVFVGLPAGRAYESPEMLIALSPTVRRMLIELALGGRRRCSEIRSCQCWARCTPPPPNTTADRAADLLAATSALGYLREARASAAPEAERLTDRIQGLVAELVAAQNEDGGWPWVTGASRRWPGRTSPRAIRATA